MSTRRLTGSRALLGTACAVGVLGLAACDNSSGPGAAGARWTRYTYDAAGTRHNPNERAIGPNTASELSVAWSFGGPAMTSTPVIVDGTIYVGGWDAYFYAIDERTGKVDWRTQLQGTVDASAQVVGDWIYVGDGKGVLHCLDRHSGELQWSTELSDNDAAHIYGSPAVIEDAGMLVIGVASVEVFSPNPEFSFRGSVVGVSTSEGEIEWRTPVARESESGPGVSVWSSAVIDSERKLAFIGTGQTYKAPASPRADALIALDYETGELKWKRQLTEDDTFTFYHTEGPDYDVGATPNLFTIDGDRDVVGVGDKAGKYVVFERESGEQVWMRQLTEGAQLGGVMTSAAYADDTIYVSSNVWNGTPLNFEDPNNAAELFALDAATGDTRWSTDLPHTSFGGLAIANGVVYDATTAGEVLALDANSGDILWEHTPGHRIGGAPSVGAGTLYVPQGFVFLAGRGGETPGTAPGGLVAYRLP